MIVLEFGDELFDILDAQCERVIEAAGQFDGRKALALDGRVDIHRPRRFEGAHGVEEDRYVPATREVSIDDGNFRTRAAHRAGGFERDRRRARTTLGIDDRNDRAVH